MKPIQVIDFEHQPWRIKFSQDGSKVLMASRHEAICYSIVELSTTFRIKPLVLFDLEFLDDQQIVVAARIASDSKESQTTLAIYDLVTPSVTSAVYDGNVRSVCVDSKRKRIFAARLSDEGLASIIGIYDYELQRQSEFQIDDFAFEMALDDLGHNLAITGCIFCEWDVSSTPKPIVMRLPEDKDCVGYLCETTSVDITPDGRYAVASLYGGIGACFVVDGTTGNTIG